MVCFTSVILLEVIDQDGILLQPRNYFLQILSPSLVSVIIEYHEPLTSDCTDTLLTFCQGTWKKYTT